MRLLRDHDAWGHVSREGRPRERIPETREEFRSHRDEEEPPEKALPVRFENLGWKGTAQVRRDRERRDQDHLGVSKRKGRPQVRLWALIGSKGGRGARKGSLASGTCSSPPWYRGGRRPRGGPAPGGCIPVPRSPQMMSTAAVQEEVGGGERRKDPVPLGQGSWTRDIIERSGAGAGRRARVTGNLLACTGQFLRGQAG